MPVPTIMRYNGKILSRNGLIATNSRCCCDGPPPPEGCYTTDCYCCQENKAPSLMRLTLNGLLPSGNSNSCPYCGNFNGTTVDLARTSFCSWGADLTPLYPCRRLLPSEVFKWYTMGVGIYLFAVDETHCQFRGGIAWSNGGTSFVSIEYQSAILDSPVACLSLANLPLAFRIYRTGGSGGVAETSEVGGSHPCKTSGTYLLLSALPAPLECP